MIVWVKLSQFYSITQAARGRKECPVILGQAHFALSRTARDSKDQVQTHTGRVITDKWKWSISKPEWGRDRTPSLRKRRGWGRRSRETGETKDRLSQFQNKIHSSPLLIINSCLDQGWYMCPPLSPLGRHSRHNLSISLGSQHWPWYGAPGKNYHLNVVLWNHTQMPFLHWSQKLKPARSRSRNIQREILDTNKIYPESSWSFY